MKNSISIIAIAALGFLVASFIQPGVITGKVTDSNGKPLHGVSISTRELSNSSVHASTFTSADGSYRITVDTQAKILVYSFPGYRTIEEKIEKRSKINVIMTLEAIPIPERAPVDDSKSQGRVSKSEAAPASSGSAFHWNKTFQQSVNNFNTEGYAGVNENGFRNVKANPLSTFSIDVDNASYSNIRRFINNGELPPADAVRIEEMINYFKYDYPEPRGEHPFSVYTELAVCPWNKKHQLLHVGLRGRSINKSSLPPSNLVFLIDVSGSMNNPNKLPLLKSALRLLVNELRAQDMVTIVVYAGSAGLVLEPTRGNNKDRIRSAIDNLEAGGSTAGGAGLKLAYREAEKNFIKGGNNRIILATDGDFNVGESSNGAMERMIEEKRESGIFITVLGFGMGNLKDDKMEIIADKGNGNYSYIDNLQEARRVLINEFGGTLFTIAKDVKFQLEFNPSKVKSYRLIGYENRLLNEEDFNDDAKDAGEMGSGHNVTALYELIPAGSRNEMPGVDPLKYQPSGPKFTDDKDYSEYDDQKDISREYLTIKLRYKMPDGHTSRLLEKPVKDYVSDLEEASDNFKFAAAVSEFGMILRNSEFKGNSTLENAALLARSSRGEDEDGYRAELIRLINTVKGMRMNEDR